ncbi:MAG: pyridoxamine 5'-phosphate oxidase [Runella sp.]
MSIKIADLRQDYQLNDLSEQDVLKNPFDQFRRWFEEAVHAQALEPNAMTLSTISADGYPQGRIVLLKELDVSGFVFFTNYQSHKGQALAQSPKASLTFWWAELERQVRVVGRTEKIDEAASDAYFASRPRGSQLGAWVSAQSEVIENREVLDQQWQYWQNHFGEGTIPRPPHWGGYRVVPHEIEFWQGRPSRLHDRIRYRLLDNSWLIERLSP